MSSKLNEFKADHSGGDVVKGAEIEDATDAAGGPVQNRLADVKKPVNPATFANPGAEPVSEGFGALFDNTDLSEEFKAKATLVFEAAVNEAATMKASEITEALEAEFEVKLTESVNEAMDAIVENLDNYLDYVVSEWMVENTVAIESGIKVTMAESFMAGLKDLFESHNVDINEETIDVVSSLEEEIAALEEKANTAINESIALTNEIASLKAEKVFNGITEGLTVPQVERMRILSEKLDASDLKNYSSDLGTLKESFFSKKTVKALNENVEEENEILLEETTPKRISQFDSVNSIVSFLNSRNT